MRLYYIVHPAGLLGFCIFTIKYKNYTTTSYNFIISIFITTTPTAHPYLKSIHKRTNFTPTNLYTHPSLAHITHQPIIEKTIHNPPYPKTYNTQKTGSKARFF